jgi:hypothetical protein
MQRSQIYLSEIHLSQLAAFARARSTTHSALVREALDDYLARQEPLDKQALREQAFGAWLPEGSGPSLPDLRSEERHF